MQWNPNTFPQAPTRTGKGKNTTQHVETRLVFGRSIPKGGTVDDYAIRAFLDSYVGSRFPLGFNYTESRGVWKGGQEDSFSVSVVYPDTVEARRDYGVRLEEIRAEYVRLFRQDSVLRIDGLVSVSF